MSTSPVTLDMSTAQPIGQPVNLDMSTAEPIDSAPPGFVARASQQAGLSQHPVDQLISELQRLKNDPTGTLWETIKQPIIGLRDLTYNLVTDPVRTAQAVSGGPQFAQDVANKNWAGAAGTLAGGALQAASGRLFPGQGAATSVEEATQRALQMQPANAASLPSPVSVPTRDVIAENPGELARLQAAGVRGQAPLTVLPTTNRGLALPGNAPAPPIRDVIAATPGEQARLSAVGQRMTQPVTLPAENRGLALPPGPSTPVAAEPLPPMPAGASTIPRTLSGESALNQVLTGLDNKTLLKVARSRGIDVGKEAQLKPGVANDRIIKKIINDFSWDELQDVRDTYLETTRMTPTPWEGSTPESWHVRVLQQYFPDVQIPAAMLKRTTTERSTSLASLLSAGK